MKHSHFFLFTIPFTPCKKSRHLFSLFFLTNIIPLLDNIYYFNMLFEDSNNSSPLARALLCLMKQIIVTA